MGYLPQYMLSEIAADVEAAVQGIARKYGVSIRYDGPRPDDDCDYPRPDGIVLEIQPAGEHDLSEQAKEHKYWKSVFGVGDDEQAEDGNPSA